MQSGAPPALSEPTDEQLGAYVQHLFTSRKSKSEALAVACAAQHRFPALRGRLPTSWRVLKAWSFQEPSQCRLPWPPQLALALIALANLQGCPEVGFCLALMFHCLLRPAEATCLRRRDLNVGDSMKWLSRPMGVVTIGSPKTRRTGPRIQHVTIDNALLLSDLEQWLQPFHPDVAVFPSYKTLSRLVKAWLSALLGKEGAAYTLGGLRAGGATFFYLETENAAFAQRRGRWASQRSLDHYIQTAAAVLGSAAWSGGSRGKVERLAALAPAYLART